MKTPSFFIAVLLLGTAALQAQVLTTFGNTATNGGGWSYNPATSTISGTEGFGDNIYGTPLVSSISLSSQIRLTGNATTAPAGSFTITLEDGLGKVATAQYQWSDFIGGATLTKPFNFVQGGFNFSNLAGWSLDSGGSLQPVNASFSQLSAVAVPESSAFAYGAVVLLGLCIARREVRKRSA